VNKTRQSKYLDDIPQHPGEDDMVFTEEASESRANNDVVQDQPEGVIRTALVRDERKNFSRNNAMLEKNRRT
jgi:hypothetical protein